MTWKISLIASLVFVSGCKEDMGFKLYISNPSLGGITRAQDSELIPYDKTEDFYCVSESTMRRLAEMYRSCQELQK